MNDDYLWDGSGEADAEVQRLERLLGRLRLRAEPPLLPRRPGRVWPGALAAAAAVFFCAGLAWWGWIGPAGSWRVARWSGPSAQRPSPEAGHRLGVGDWLETDQGSHALLQAAGLGQIVVEPGSRLRLVASSLRDQRIALARGKIVATISAPPRLFSVETSSARTVDLGCEYTLSVEPGGATRVAVSRGWVEMSWGGRSAIVPAGYADATRPGRGPGTPWIDGAPPALLAALERFDSGRDAAALDEILALARPADALSLWHLLSRTEGGSRERVYDALARLSPPPPGVTRAAALALDADALELWRFEMGTPLLPRRPSVWRAFWARWTRAVFGG